MANTLSHFGPSALVAILFYRYINFPVFVLANIVIDIESVILALFRPGPSSHKYFHTFILGAATGIVWGLVCYASSDVLQWTTNLLKLPYELSLAGILLSAVTGIWLHIVIDAVSHPRMIPFYPLKGNPLITPFTNLGVSWLCTFTFIPAVVLYFFVKL